MSNTVLNIRHSSDDIQELAAVWPLCFLFKLPPHSRSIVAGAYKGKVIQLLADMYPDYGGIFGFDPQSWAIEHAAMRLNGYKNVKLFPCGIGLYDAVVPMGEWETDACSFVNNGENARVIGEGKMVNGVKIFTELDITPTYHLDLAVFNMEGYEFDLLPYLIEHKLIDCIDRLAVQFHHGFGNDFDFHGTMDALNITHKRVVDQLPQWGYWENREMYR